MSNMNNIPENHQTLYNFYYGGEDSSLAEQAGLFYGGDDEDGNPQFVGDEKQWKLYEELKKN